MTTTTRDTLQDRLDALADYLLPTVSDIYSDEEVAEFAYEAKGIEDALRRDSINDVAEYTLTDDYESRDGYHDNRTWRRNVNIDMLAAGKLEQHDPNTIHYGGRPRMVTIGGVKYYSAV